MLDPTSALLRLSNTGLTLSDAAQDVRGRKVYDANDRHIGHVEDLMIDDREKKVRFLLVETDGFLGLGKQRFLLPVEIVTRITPERVTVDRTQEHLAGAPLYNPQVGLDEKNTTAIYGYYGFAPFWVPGYSYPAFPYYV